MRLDKIKQRLADFCGLIYRKSSNKEFAFVLPFIYNSKLLNVGGFQDSFQPEIHCWNCFCGGNHQDYFLT